MRPLTNEPMEEAPTVRKMLTAVLCCLAGCVSANVPAESTTVQGITFSHIWETRDEAGQTNPWTHIDLGALEGGTPHEFDLGEGRVLMLHDHVGWLDKAELLAIYETVRRCYLHIQASTGMKVPGGLLYFLLPLDPANNSYTISYQVQEDELESWSWAASIAFLPREGVFRKTDYSLDLYEEMLLSTPHELTEGLVASIENLRVDVEGGRSNHTRWFHDGAPEYVSSMFAKQELPWLWSADSFDRHRIHEVLDDDGIRQGVLGWVGSGAQVRVGTDDYAPVQQYLMYGAAQLLIEVWTQSIPLPQILERIQSHAGPVDGDELLTMVEETTGLNRDQFLEAARQHGRSQEPSEGQ